MEVKECRGGGAHSKEITWARVWRGRKGGTCENALCSVLFCSDWLKGRVGQRQEMRQKVELRQDW